MTFIQENAYLILLHGCSVVEDFNNIRSMCGPAASHANTKLPPAKYMAVADPAGGPPPPPPLPLSQGVDDRPPPPSPYLKVWIRHCFRSLFLRVKKNK